MMLSEIRDLCREAAACHGTGRLTEGQRLATAAVTGCRESLGQAHYAYPLCLCTLAWLKEAAGTDPAPLVDEALALARSLLPSDYEHGRAVLTQIRDYHLRRGERPAAQALQRELIAACGDELGINHPRYFAARAELDQL